MGFRFYRRTGGDCVAPVKLIPSAASMTWVKGTPVNMESGLANVGAPADTAFAGICNQTITVGSGGAGTLIEVIMALDDVEFIADFTDAGTKKTFTNADLLGTLFDLNATDPTVIDPDDTTGGAWAITGFINSKKKVICKLSSTKRAAGI